MARISEKNRFRCKACDEVTPYSALLKAPSPFDASDTLTACPVCKQCDVVFELLCDEDGCNDDATCGWHTGDNADQWGGYRNTCGRHWKDGAQK